MQLKDKLNGSASPFPMIVAEPPGQQVLNPAPVKDLETIKETLEALPADWYLDCLKVTQMMDTSTPDGLQAMALHLMQITTALQVFHERLRQIEERLFNDADSGGHAGDGSAG